MAKLKGKNTMDQGYVKLWRKSLDSGLMRNPNLWLFWCWCLLKASHKEKTVMVGHQEIVLKPGQFVFGRRKAAEYLNLSEQTIRTCLKCLKSTNNLTIKTTSKFSIISIVNWDTYDQQVTTNKNVKNVKNIKNTNWNEAKCTVKYSSKYMTAHCQKIGRLSSPFNR